MFSLVGILAASSAAFGEELEEKPFEKAGISIRLPKGWQVDERGQTMLARAKERDKDSHGEFRAVLTITSDAGKEINGELQQARAAKGGNEYKAVEKPEAVTINGLEGVKFGGTMQPGPVRLRSRQYLLVHENRIYTLTFVCLLSRWNSYVGTFEASVATFKAGGAAGK
jgi:hypothetical protein